MDRRLPRDRHGAGGHWPQSWHLGQCAGIGPGDLSFSHAAIFFIAGLTFNPRCDLGTLIRRVLALMIPYFLLSLLIVPVTLHLHCEFAIADVLLGILYGSSHTIELTPMWFLPCLSLALILAAMVGGVEKIVESGQFSPGLPWLRIASALALILAGSVVVAAIAGQEYEQLAWGTVERSGFFWNADVALIAAGFLLLGSASARQLSEAAASTPMRALLVLSSLAVVIVAQQSGLRTDLNFRHFTPPWLCTFVALAGIAAMVALSQLLTMARIPALPKPFMWVGQSSLIVLWLHNGFQNLVAHLLLDRFALPEILFAAIGATLAIVIPVIVDRAFIRRFNWSRAMIYPKLAQKIAWRRAPARPELDA